MAFLGGTADQHFIDAYEYGRSIQGLSRVIKVLGHYGYSDQIIHKATSSTFDIYVSGHEAGSFKEQVYAGIVSGVAVTCLSSPIDVFMGRVMDRWLPDVETVESVLDSKINLPESAIDKSDIYNNKTEEQLEVLAQVDREIEARSEQVDVLRSILINSCKEIFRPVGRGCECAQFTVPKNDIPSKPILPETIAVMETDIRDHEIRTVTARVTSFSRGSKKGVAFSTSMGRGFKFEYQGKDENLPARDIFSWSQYEQADIVFEGEFVKFFDGTLKKMIVYYAGKTSGMPEA